MSAVKYGVKWETGGERERREIAEGVSDSKTEFTQSKGRKPLWLLGKIEKMAGKREGRRVESLRQSSNKNNFSTGLKKKLWRAKIKK